MSGTWEPVQAITVTKEMLSRYLEVLPELDMAALDQTLPATEITSGARLMKLQKEAWGEADSLDDEQLEALIRFFTLAEMQLPGWAAGKTSPVIYLVKILKSRGAFDPELKRWIKANSDNRYLPNGAVML